MRVFFAFIACLFLIVPITVSAQNFPGEDQPSQGGGEGSTGNGVSGPVCGDGECDFPTENKRNCKEDCNWKKGDGKCERKKGERKKNSPKDCGGGTEGGGNTDPPVVTTPSTTSVTPGMMTGEMILLIVSLFLNVLALVLIIVLFRKQRSLRGLVNKIFDMLEGDDGD